MNDTTTDQYPPGWNEIRMHPDGEPEYMDRDRTGITMRQWARLRQSRDRPGYVYVASYTSPDGVRVVTVWMGQRLTNAMGAGKIFETTIVRPNGTGETFCHASTEDEAILGHAVAVASIRANYIAEQQ